MVLHRYKVIFALAMLLVLAGPAYAAKVLIVTDQKSMKKAKDIQKIFAVTPPFSLMKSFTVDIKYVPAATIKCTRPLTNSNPNLPASCARLQAQAAKDLQSGAKTAAVSQVQAAKRVIVCDLSEILPTLAGEANADRTIFVKDSDEWAGAAGSSITITTKLPTIGAVHELLHTVGFGDEYKFGSECEADTYCTKSLLSRWSNVAVFADAPPYESDGAARAKHAEQIPWYSKIGADTLITHGDQLGTENGKGKVGLYRAGICDLAQPKVSSWKPGAETSVMESLSSSLVPQGFWDQIAQALGTEIDWDLQKKAPEGKDVGSGALSPNNGTR